MITNYKEALKILNHKRATTKSVTLGFEENETNKAIIEDVAIYNKLHELEDIEEEFKVDLIQVANKKCEVWFKKEIVEYDTGGNWYKELGKRTIIHNSIVTTINFDKKTLYIKGAKMWVYVNDYGKTWALTKEELEKNG